MSDTFLHTTPADPRARPLVDELTLEYDTRYGEFYDQSGEPREMDKYAPELFSPALGGHFLLLLRDGQAIAGGAFKRHDDPHTAEVKRVWTHSRHRRQGLAQRVMEALELQAVHQGYRRFYLTTGFRQPEAVGLYLGHGYTPLFDLQADRQALRKLPFEKLLHVPAAPAAPAAPAGRSRQAALSRQ
jgi:GNAT superfamily N-acetyltransferase